MMQLIEETIFTNSRYTIIDADCKKENVIVLLKGNGENLVQLNGETILTVHTGHNRIRFTKEHFCLLNYTTLTFYNLSGEVVSTCDVGTYIFDLFPYKEGIICSYGDQGVYGNRLGKNRLIYAYPHHNPESYFDIAVENSLLYEAMLARYKPYACVSWGIDELVLLNDDFKKEKTLTIPFESGNVIAFALSYEFGVFIEEHKFWLWEFETTGAVSDHPGKFSHNTRGIFHRHEFLFLTVSDHEVKVFKPIK